MKEMKSYEIYEVDKKDYEAYFYRLPENEIMKTTPSEGWTIYKDMIENIEICGFLTENVMATDAKRYFIFNFIDESRLGKPKYVKNITIPLNDFTVFFGGQNSD